MRFELNRSVIFEGEKYKVWDFSARYEEYEIKDENGHIYRGIKEDELEDAKEEKLKILKKYLLVAACNLAEELKKKERKGIELTDLEKSLVKEHNAHTDCYFGVDSDE